MTFLENLLITAVTCAGIALAAPTRFPRVRCPGYNRGARRGTGGARG